jgi:hypothetical protein
MAAANRPRDSTSKRLRTTELTATGISETAGRLRVSRPLSSRDTFLLDDCCSVFALAKRSSDCSLSRQAIATRPNGGVV